MKKSENFMEDLDSRFFFKNKDSLTVPELIGYFFLSIPRDIMDCYFRSIFN